MVAERPWYIPRKCNASFLLSGVCGCTLRLRCAARFVLRIIAVGYYHQKAYRDQKDENGATESEQETEN